jgi:AcrR family transcriptional regulator
VARIAAARDSVLTREEIAGEALRQFDQGPGEPSIRSLATQLRVAPAAIYYHFPSRAAVVHAVVERVWSQAVTDLVGLVPEPFTTDPLEVLVCVGIATRRAWLSHHRVARYMTATPEANEVIASSLALMARVFERLGLEGEQAAGAFHNYASFMLGAVLFAAERKDADERLGHAGDRPPQPFQSRRSSTGSKPSHQLTRLSIDRVMDISSIDPARDEALFEQGLRRLVKSFST